MQLYNPLAYEIQAVAAVAAEPDVTEAFHWPNVPEQALLESGYFADMGNLRRKRLRNGGFRDYGLDGLAKTASGAFVGIQAKAYGQRTTITMKILGTFWVQVSNMRLVNTESRGVLVHTPEARFEVALREAIERGSGNMSRIALPYSFDGAPAVPAPDAVTPAAVTPAAPAFPPSSLRLSTEPSFLLRPYQSRAVQDILDSEAKIALYVSPCGTGKTLVIGAVLSSLLPPLVVVASPLQVSAEQNFDRLRLFLPEHNAVKAWSDAGGTTTREAIERALEGAGERVFVSTTFETLPVVAASLRAKREGGFTIVIDEAHNLPTYSDISGDSDDGDSDDGVAAEGDGDSDEADGESDEASGAAEEASDDSGRSWDPILSAEKVFLMTATPPGSLLETNGNIGLAHRYTFAEAIADKAICDYRVYIPYISCGESGDNKDDGGDDDSSIAAKAKFLGSGMLESGARRCIVYCASREECRQFEEAFRLTCEKYYGVGVWTASITCKTPAKERGEILRAFRESPIFQTRTVRDEGTKKPNEERKPVLRIVTAVRILDESVDIPECDAVFLTKCSGSTSSPLAPARAVQRLCRATRVCPGKTRASVFVWTLDGCDEAGLLHTFSLLRDNDVDFADKIVAVSRNYDDKGTAASVRRAEITVAAFRERYIVRAVTPDEMWNIRFTELVAFQKDNGRLPSPHRDGKLGTWVNTQRTLIVKKMLRMDREEKLVSLDFWKAPVPTKARLRKGFAAQLADVVEFYRVQGRLPTKKENYWPTEQRQHYKKGKLAPERIAAILEAIPDWLWEPDPFPGQLADVVEFKRVQGRLPTKKDNYWPNTQRQLYKKGKLTPERIAAILEAIPDWLWEEPDPFPAQLADVVEFKRVQGRLPTQKENTWVYVQRRLHKKGKLAPERIAAILEAIPDWPWEEPDPFPENLAEVVEFKKVHGRLPTQKENRWLYDQRKLYKKGKLAPERIAAILEAFPDFFQ